MIVDILNFFIAVATVVLGYNLFIERTKKGKKMSELKGLSYSFFTCLILLWIINIFIGFIK